jgi:hypothetical protein
MDGLNHEEVRIQLWWLNCPWDTFEIQAPKQELCYMRNTMVGREEIPP